MGIKQLYSIIKDEAPGAIKEGDIKNQFGRKVAIVSRPVPPLPSCPAPSPSLCGPSDANAPGRMLP